MDFYPWLLWLTPRERRLQEHSELAAEDKEWEIRRRQRCPRCRLGVLDEYTGVCRVCGYPEFNEDEPCYECEGSGCDGCEYARELRRKLKERYRCLSGESRHLRR